MVYNIGSGSGDIVHIPELYIIRKHDVSETGPVSVVMWGDEDTFERTI
jgi:hypothetical protein